MMQVTCSAGTLRALPLFSLLSDAERDAVQPWTQIRTYAARTPILHQGDTTEGVYLVLAGRVNVVLEDGPGHRVIVDVLGENQLFNECALVRTSAAAQTFEAQRSCEILYAPRKPLIDCVMRNPEAAMFLACALAERLDHAYRKLGSFAHEDVYARVMEILLTRGRDEGSAWHVEVGAEAMSSLVGASREMVSRVVKDLVKRGLVRRQKRKLVVDNRAALREWASNRRSSSQEKRQAVASSRSAKAPVAAAAP